MTYSAPRLSFPLSLLLFLTSLLSTLSPSSAAAAFLPGNSLSDSVKAVFSRAFQKWAAVIPLTFTETSSYGEADIMIDFYSGDHGDGELFDGVFGTLAHAFSPPTGRLHLDLTENWVVDGDVTSSVAVDLESVAVHELGHVLGLGHSSEREAIMYPTISTGTKKVDLAGDDVEGIQVLYGSNPNYNGSTTATTTSQERDTNRSGSRAPGGKGNGEGGDGGGGGGRGRGGEEGDFNVQRSNLIICWWINVDFGSVAAEGEGAVHLQWLPLVPHYFIFVFLYIVPCCSPTMASFGTPLKPDEATAAPDAVLQRIIREEFSDCTVITVAHKVPMVIDSDMVMVLSFGKLDEYNEPSKLMETNSSFSKLVTKYWSSCRMDTV
ncbi:hypothetical protein Vadar_015441 [Vaccinium darrowii]|uniref:Uncharacterized protein n=1 Tax=Vaccinium darrowii TaxID=229202 RepID=A0ACB7ZJR5_9ERIC|nr:hypothetical protein Vadar_015441 [Vaccinium darrowii]